MFQYSAISQQKVNQKIDYMHQIHWHGERIHDEKILLILVVHCFVSNMNYYSSTNDLEFGNMNSITENSSSLTIY